MADAVIDQSVVRIRPDFKGFRAELRAELKKATTNISVTAKVKLVADVTGFRRTAMAELKKVAPLTMKVKLVADGKGIDFGGGKAARGAARSAVKEAVDEVDKEWRKAVAEMRRETQKLVLRPEVEAFTDEDGRLLKHELSRYRDVVERFQADEERAWHRHNQVLKAEQDAAFATYGRHIEDMDGLHAEALADHAVFTRRSAALARQATAEARRNEAEQNRIAREGARARSTYFRPPKIIDLGGEGLRPMNALLAAAVALSPALIAVASSAAQASTSIVALGSAAYGGALAVTGLVTAFSGVLGALKLHDALQKAQVGQAGKATIARAKENKQVTAVAQAYKDAAQKVKDLRNELAALQVQQSGNKLDAEEAEQRRRSIEADFFSTDLMKRQARQAVLEARQRGRDIAHEIDKTRRDLAGRRKTGLGGAPEVTQAKGLEVAAAAPLSQMSQLQAALKELSPAARELYDWVLANTEQFKKYRRAIEQAILPGFLSFLKSVTADAKGSSSTVEVLVDGVERVGRVISGTTAQFGRFFASPFFKGSLQKLNEDNEKSFTNLGNAARAFARPLTRLLVAASPLMVRFTKYLDIMANRFSKWIDGFSDAELLTWFDKAGDRLSDFWSIATNLFSFLKSVFTASLPTGDNLVTRFKEITAQLASWAKSDKGQTKIREFFEFFKNLPYGDIAKTAGSIGALVGVWTAAKFSLKNPFFTAMGLFAMKYPEETRVFLERVTGSVLGVLKYIENNTVVVASFLAVMSALKGTGKTKPLGDLIGKIPGLKLFGERGASVANPMYVMVVNGGTGLTGGTSTGGGGGGGKGGGAPVATPIGKDPKTGKDVYIDPKTKRPTTRVPKGFRAPVRLGPTGGAFAGLAAGMVAAPLLDAAFGPTQPGTQADQWKSTLNGAAMGAGFGTALGPLGVAIGAGVGAAVGAIAANGGFSEKDTAADRRVNNTLAAAKAAGNPAAAQIAAEARSFSTLHSRLGSGGMNVIRNDPAAAAKYDPLQQWIASRRTSVTAYANSIRMSDGPIAAEKALFAENAKSRKALADTLVQFGWTTKAAQTYADKVFGSAAADEKARLANMGLYESLGVTSTVVDKLNPKLGTMSEVLDDVSGERKIVITMADGSSKVFDDLKSAVIYQQALKRGASVAEISKQKNLYEKQERIGAATGGHIRGPGTETSDSIPARLSDNEFVQPAKAVRHYGVGFMEAVRTRKLPKFAAGGLVANTWPFKVDLSQTQIPSIDAGLGIGAGGRLIGSPQIAAIAEATARAMGATEKQLIALISAGIVESGMRNLNYGDRDSVGFLQQRPSMGWGSVKQLMDPAYATRKFMAKAKRIDKPGYSAGQLAQAVQVSAFPHRYGEEAANAIAILNSFPPYVGAAPGGGGGSRSALVAFGRWLQARGYDVSEHPEFGGVRGGHVSGSWHYRAGAIDVNRGAGTSAREQRLLSLIIPEARRRGLNSIFMSKGHYNHAHFDIGKYDQGGVLRPGVTMAVNNTGKPETVRTYEQEKALQRGGTTRIDRRDLALLAAHMVNGINGQYVRMDGRKVAEVVRGYDYLPRGI